MTGPCLITGAGSGLGLRVAELLAQRGETVLALDLHLGDAARSRLERAGDVRFAEADVTDGEAVRAAVDRLGAPRLVVNFAGIILAKPFAELSEDEFRRVVDVNLVGSRNVAAATLPFLRGGGHLVLVASLAGLVGNYAYAAYGASKFGVVGLAEVLRIETAPDGVRVSVVCPPEVETPMVDTERLTMHPATRALKALPGSLQVEPAAQEILAGIDSGRFMVVPGRRARATVALSRFGPRKAGQAVIDATVRRALRRSP